MSFISMLEKNYNSLLPKKELDLPEIRIYLKENEFESWFENLPLSKNQWIKSYVLSNTKEKLLKTKIKLGDNPTIDTSKKIF